LAYWQIMRATDRIGRGARAELTPADLRLLAGRPASMADVLEAWIATKPTKGGGAESRGGAVQALMSQAADPAKVRRLFGG